MMDYIGIVETDYNIIIISHEGTTGGDQAVGAAVELVRFTFAATQSGARLRHSIE